MLVIGRLLGVRNLLVDVIGFNMTKAKLNLNLDTNISQDYSNTCEKCDRGRMIVTIRRNLFNNQYTSFCPVCGHTIKKKV